MITTIVQIEGEQGIVLDSTLLQSAKLQLGDEVNVEVHESGIITVTPAWRAFDAEEVSTLIEETLAAYAKR